MAQAKGYKSVLQIVEEATYGTDPGSGHASVPIVSHTLRAVQQQEDIPTVTGIRSAAPLLPGITNVQGDIVVPIDAVHFADWLAFMFDDVTGLLLDTQPSFTAIDAAVDVSLFKYTGLKIAKLAMTFSRRQPMRATLSVAGANMTAAVSAEPDAVTAIAPYTLAHLAFLEGGLALAGGTELSIEVDFGLRADDFVITGPAYRKALEEGGVTVTGRLTTILGATTQLAKALANTETSLGVTLNNGTTTLTVTLPEVLFAFPELDVPGPQGRMVVLPFSAHVDDDEDASAIQITLAANPE